MSRHDCRQHLYLVGENEYLCSVCPNSQKWARNAFGDYIRLPGPDARNCPACGRLIEPEMRSGVRVWPSHATRPWVECRMSLVPIP